MVHCISREIQSCNSEAVFVDSVIVEGVSLGHCGYTDDGVVPRQQGEFAEGKREVPGRGHHLLLVMRLHIQIAAKVMAVTGKTDGSTHKKAPFVRQ